jgi:antitoxin CptB
MSGSMLSSSALDERRRRILFRAWRRGVREMDLIMGRFADAHLPTMNEDELAEFERLLDVPDTQVLAWIVGGEAPPREFMTPLFARLRGLERDPEEWMPVFGQDHAQNKDLEPGSDSIGTDKALR